MVLNEVLATNGAVEHGVLGGLFRLLGEIFGLFGVFHPIASQTVGFVQNTGQRTQRFGQAPRPGVVKRLVNLANGPLQLAM